MYEKIKCNAIDGDFDCHAAGAIRRESHRPMERFGGFMRSPKMPPPGKCSRRIGLADAMVIDAASKKNTKHN